MQADLNGFKPGLNLSFLSNVSSNYFSNDFNRTWYLDSSMKIISIMIVNAFFPYLTNIIFLPLYRWIRKV